MKLSERIPHDKRCPVAKYESGECTCYVSDVAQLEEERAKHEELEDAFWKLDEEGCASLAVQLVKLESININLLACEKEVLEAKLTAIECSDCHKTMLECACDD